MIGIIGALVEEIELIKSDMKITKTEKISRCEYTVGTLFGQDIVVLQCGMGKVNAAVCASVLIERYSPDIIINTGVGGALDNKLKVFDIVISGDVVQHDYDLVPLGYKLAQVDNFSSPYFKCDEKLNNLILDTAKKQHLNCSVARFATGDQFIAGEKAKDHLRNIFAASVCEMESGAIAQTCALAGVRFTAIRTISDSSTGKDNANEFVTFLREASSRSAGLIKSVIWDIDKIL